MISFKTKNAAAYETLRGDIIGGRLKPGQKINMSEISKELGLSESPVREAIRRLESDGFVKFTPHVGAVISKMDIREFVETYLIRIELEPLATRLAVPHITEKDIHFLLKKNQEMEVAIERKNYEKLGGLNKDFHLKIYGAAPYPYLFKLISDLWEKVERTQSVFAYVPARGVESVKEHTKIIQAIQNRKPILAEQLIKAQKSRTMAALEKFLKENE